MRDGFRFALPILRVHVGELQCRLILRHCERSEAIQNPSAERLWITSLRSQWRCGGGCASTAL